MTKTAKPAPRARAEKGVAWTAGVEKDGSRHVAVLRFARPIEKLVLKGSLSAQFMASTVEALAKELERKNRSRNLRTTRARTMAREKPFWLAYRCLDIECGTMADIRVDGPKGGIPQEEVPPMACPRCDLPMHWMGEWAATAGGYGSRGDLRHEAECPASSCTCATGAARRWVPK